MMAVPRYKPHAGPVLFSAGFRPFFLVAAIWAALAVPIWLAAYAHGTMPPTAMQPTLWHPHELVFGYGAAVVAGFLLTAIPNWTGRLPLQGWPLATLVLLWLAGRVAVLFSADITPVAATVVDLIFPATFLVVVAREIISGKNWRNLPMVAALSLLVIGNLLVHLEPLGIAETGQLGNRLGIAVLLSLIALVGGRIVPSFTRNWLAKAIPEAAAPAPSDRLDQVCLVLIALSVAIWALLPDGAVTPYVLMIAGAAAVVRLSRWRALKTGGEPMLLVLHLGYGWLAFGLLFLGLDGVLDFIPQTSALHGLTVGAIGTMTLAVMTRASLGHTGRPLTAGPATIAIYVLVTLAGILRLLATVPSASSVHILTAAGTAWSVAFLLFAVFYGRALSLPRTKGADAKAI